MEYISTRGLSPAVSAQEAILAGPAPDGGLYLPETIPALDAGELKALGSARYEDAANLILRKYLSEDAFPAPELRKAVSDAYARFDGPEPVFIRAYDDGLSVLELWHGPTCAFKDMALQLFPRLLPLCRKAVPGREDEESWIVTATSGDTGKAALEGFRDQPGIRVFVFYPAGGVSAVQELQMRTQEGNNVCVTAVKGNFDDAQTGVKKLFRDESLAKTLGKENVRLSSANSINWGRLLPQIVYYAYASAKISQNGEPVDFVVPTGNFGNILAGCIARRMGCPVGKLVCASNENRVLTDFFETGVYDRRREFRKTASPSMDILISSNLERLLFLESGGDAERVRDWMERLNAEGYYRIPVEMRKRLSETFGCGSASDRDAFEAIRKAFSEKGMLIDPHTAVGLFVLEKRRSGAGSGRKTVLVSTASPFKFAPDVLFALTGEKEDGFRALDRLSEISALQIPEPLDGLRTRPVRFSGVCEKEGMADVLLAAAARAPMES